ncbi:NAD(P)/FAD-dependent oxidoreductase [Eubacterium callanderi]|uniref:NAD(P)/FAD-dependent oxidoreductase n=1 Tax=Eubacterium callanderi TaxID=53442 RepID=UPI00241C2A08|nr:FAD-dependent oxidoreductase [Eubacterium callanderi]
MRTAQSAEKNGVHFAFDEEVQEIIEHENHFEVVTGRRSLNARYVVNTAGGMAMAVESGVRPQDLIIKPRCGQFLVFDRQGKDGIRHVLYQAQETDEKGCLLAPSTEGNIIAGPTSQDVPDYKNVETTDWGIHHIEKTAKKILPDLDMGKVITSFAGVRANIKNVVKEEKDFIIRRSVPRMVSALGIKNPGMTAAPYLCQMILDLLIEDGLCTAPNPDYCPVLDLPKPFLKQTENIQKKWYEQDHRYGNLVCRCEGITEGDILRVLREPLPPKNMNGLKKRLRTTMGRCQGSFCTPRILEILSREWSVPPEKIMKEAPGSPFVKGRVK